MLVPITSEVTIELGMVLREISTEKPFVVAERVKPGREVSGEDIWKISPADPGYSGPSPLVFTRQELSEKYFAEV